MGDHADANVLRKQQLRRQFRRLRLQLLPGCEASVQARLAEALPALLARQGRRAFQAGGRRWLGLYWPLPGEIDLRAALSSAALDGQGLALPAIADGGLRFRPWEPGSRLSPDACGIPAPEASAGELAPSDLSVLLVPALAADREGIRLGYGGGWYDRLRSRKDWKRIPALAVLPQGCLTARLPRDSWDVPMDGWLTEAGLIWRRLDDEA